MYWIIFYDLKEEEKHYSNTNRHAGVKNVYLVTVLLDM